MASRLEELWDEVVHVHSADSGPSGRSGQQQLTSFQKKKLDVVAADVWKRVAAALEEQGTFVDAKGATEPDDPRLPGLVEKLEEQLAQLVDEINDIRHEFPPAMAERAGEELRRKAPRAEDHKKTTPEEDKDQAKGVPADPAVLGNFKENIEALARLTAQIRETLPATAAKAEATREVLAEHVRNPPSKLEQVLLRENERELGDRKRTAPEVAAPARKSAKGDANADAYSTRAVV